MKNENVEFDAVSDDGRKFRIKASGDYGRTTHDDYLVRKSNAISWKVIDLGLLVHAVGALAQPAISITP